MTQALSRRDPTNTDWQYQRGNMLADLGFALIDSGEFKDGVAQIEAAIEVQKASSKGFRSCPWTNKIMLTIREVNEPIRTFFKRSVVF